MHSCFQPSKLTNACTSLLCEYVHFDGVDCHMPILANDEVVDPRLD